MDLKKTRALPLFMMFACAPVWADLTVTPSSTAVKTDGAWRGSFNAGVSTASGNTSSVSINGSADAQWADTTNKFIAALTGLYGTSTSDGNESVSNNLITFSAELDHNISPKVYELGLFNAQRNELQDLNFQSSIAGGFGYHVIQGGPTAFDVFGGVSYNYEKYSQSTRQYPELLIGESLTQKIGATTSFNERLAVYPNMGYIGNVRTQLDLGLTTAIADRLQLKMTLSNSYQNQPVGGVKKMDTLFMTSIGYTFGPK